ncbi:hypothetical protein J5F16_22295 [Pseudomonas aeruginosa]|uniref:hypothetical protein n=1 Tax=Pseudomonas aeruginosa TaxID=287 RepID=UPI00071B9ACE|nr:hypothetical protein [Pseudomonas aeruginosa]KSO03756.1 hypothetical protein APA96_09745 [Pseudomonas aeruginosa]MBP8439495.1 hypothetical protein [Pseudomonas aeruginosa]MBP8447311.1 hypothetical protein [Pseudomonas aeruginosa]MBP8467748.1 hypothetical protein [Pseudomonas aeruginosa]MBP8481003.1 hypothetical protein [Pseudomonas aeruginosa]
MSFSDFMTDAISVQKQTGEKLEGLKASVQSNSIFLNRSDVLIEPRDLIVRAMSNGASETYEVIDPGFHEKFGGIEAHYQMKVKKLGIPEAEARIQSITYHINGNNARVNHDSVDNSTNTVTIGGGLQEHVDSLRQIIATLQDVQERKDATDIVDAVEANLASQKPSKTVVSALLGALPHVASISTIASAIISAL